MEPQRATTVSAVAQTKGANILSALEVIRQRLPAAALEQAIDRLPVDLRQRLRMGGVVHGGWYPVDWYALILHEVGKHNGMSRTFMRDLGHDLVARDLRGLYKILVKFISPEMLLSWGPRTFGQYYKGGVLRVQNTGPGMTVAQYSHWRGFSPEIWLTVAGGVEAALEACGARQVSAEIAEGGTDQDARLIMHWLGLPGAST